MQCWLSAFLIYVNLVYISYTYELHVFRSIKWYCLLNMTTSFNYTLHIKLIKLGFTLPPHRQPCMYISIRLGCNRHWPRKWLKTVPVLWTVALEKVEFVKDVQRLYFFPGVNHFLQCLCRCQDKRPPARWEYKAYVLLMNSCTTPVYAISH